VHHVIRVGPAGWSYPDWIGPVYPRRRPKGFHPLRWIAPSIDCVEVNSSFYGIPAAKSADRWVSVVEDRPDFRFVAKLYRGFTHESWGVEREPEVTAFREGISPLREAGVLAALLVQFPLSFRRSPASLERLRRIRDRFGDVPLVVEVRHRTWFEPDGIDALSPLEVSLAHIDLPSAPDHPPEEHAILGPVGYLRLHGRNREAWFAKDAGRDRRYDWLYSPDEIQGLASRARAIAARRAETFVITNNHYGGKGMANAIELKSILSGVRVPVPETLLAAYPRLEAHAQREPGSLF
jgi:uncharacterized protein YecE (DUF72 family)